MMCVAAILLVAGPDLISMTVAIITIAVNIDAYHNDPQNDNCQEGYAHNYYHSYCYNNIVIIIILILIICLSCASCGSSGSCDYQGLCGHSCCHRHAFYD